LHSVSFVIKGESKGESISHLAITAMDLPSYIYVFVPRSGRKRRRLVDQPGLRYILSGGLHRRRPTSFTAVSLQREGSEVVRYSVSRGAGQYAHMG
jgi:hypothetical protein